MSRSKLFLLDGMALAYRSHFAFINANLKNREGIPTGPILGFANTLIKLLEEEEPTHIAVAWESEKPTFRHEMDEDYKANRPPQPEELEVGIPLIQEMLEYFGISNLQHEGYEADDVIGSLAYQAEEDDVEAFLVTPDKDFMQLVDNHIKMYKPLNKADGFDIIDRDKVQEYFGVGPGKVVDVLAIIGDTSDNVPGVKGIGKKGAPKIINEYGDLETAIEHAPEMKSKRHREGLQEYADEARHAKKMVKIHTDIKDIVSWQKLKWKGPDKEKLARFFRRMEFRSLIGRYLGDEYMETPSDDPGQGDLFSGSPEQKRTSYDDSDAEYILVESRGELETAVRQCRESEAFSFDTETDSTDPVTAKLVGISLSPSEQKGYYIPLNGELDLDLGQVMERLQPLFSDTGVTKVAHHYKYDYIMLHKQGLTFDGPIFDTMIATYLHDADQKLKMDALAQKYLNYECIPIEEVLGSGRNQKTMDELPVDDVTVYACEDADITLRLYNVLQNQLEEDGLGEIAEKIEFPLIPVLAHMELRGIELDLNKLKQFSKELDKELKEYREKIYEKAGEEFNINSSQQLSHILFEKMDLPPGKKTKTGQYSTSEDVLSKLADEYEMPGLILDYRSLKKLQSTYVDALPKLVNEETGRIHTQFNQSIAATGRLSSSNPNLQNIPIRTKKGRKIREAFVADEGFQLLSADYSQVELRIIASIAEDEAMISAFESGEDIHSRTAKEIFGLEAMDQVNDSHRRKAKEVNYGIPYGVSAYGLANRLGISNEEGKELIDQYFERFPGISRYINETRNFAKENGYVKTLLGRRRYIPNINARNWNMRAFAERTAINMPIQGTAADIIKIAMIDIENYLEENNFDTRMLLQVHDELIFEISREEIEQVQPVIRERMEKAYELKVPLEVDMGVADNWLEAH